MTTDTMTKVSINPVIVRQTLADRNAVFAALFEQFTGHPEVKEIIFMLIKAGDEAFDAWILGKPDATGKAPKDGVVVDVAVTERAITGYAVEDRGLDQAGNVMKKRHPIYEETVKELKKLVRASDEK